MWGQPLRTCVQHPRSAHKAFAQLAAALLRCNTFCCSAYVSFKVQASKSIKPISLQWSTMSNKLLVVRLPVDPFFHPKKRYCWCFNPIRFLFSEDGHCFLVEVFANRRNPKENQKDDKENYLENYFEIIHQSWGKFYNFFAFHHGHRLFHSKCCPAGKYLTNSHLDIEVHIITLPSLLMTMQACTGCLKKNFL